jgi:hypothetical protein
MKTKRPGGTGVPPVRIEPHRRTGILPVSIINPPPSTPDLETLITRAIEHGWLRHSPAPKIKTESHLRRELRARWHARGLNSRGRPRRNRRRPELTGLDRQTYLRKYMRLWRLTRNVKRKTQNVKRKT